MADNATLYIADPSLLGDKLFNRFEGVLSHEGLTDGEAATGIRFCLEAGEVVVTFMPLGQTEQHLAGFSGFAENMIEDQDKLIYALSRIAHVRLVLGCVITPGFDEPGTIIEFLLQLNASLNGLLFFSDSIFDYDAEPLTGEACEEES